MSTDPGSSQPPLQPKKPSNCSFSCYIRPFRRLKTAIKNLKDIGKAHKHQQNNSIVTSMQISPAGFQFKVINGGQVLGMFTMLSNSSNISTYDYVLKKSTRYGIHCSAFSRILSRARKQTDGIWIFKRPLENHLYCRYVDEKKKEKTYNVALSPLNEAINFNPQNVKPFCTVVIKGKGWRKGLLKFLRIRKRNAKGMILEITRQGVKFHTEEYNDDSNSFTYTKKTCNIMINDEVNDHMYTVNLPLFVDKPLTRASKLGGTGVIRLFYGNKVFMTLSFERKSSQRHNATCGSIVFVYHPIAFLDRILFPEEK